MNIRNKQRENEDLLLPASTSVLRVVRLVTAEYPSSGLPRTYTRLVRETSQKCRNYIPFRHR
jgi:hypothetical protein